MLKKLIYFLATFSALSAFGQIDTLRNHYIDATISVPLELPTGNGYASGQGEDLSRGKAMFFDSQIHASPTTALVDVLFDIELFNPSEQDSFTVRIWRDQSGSFVELWFEEDFSCSQIGQTSTPIGIDGPAAYNFSLSQQLNQTYFADNIGSLKFWVELAFPAVDTPYLALRATGADEFLDAGNRTFTFDAIGNRIDFVSAYDLNAALAIFPVTEFSSGIDDQDVHPVPFLFMNADNMIYLNAEYFQSEESPVLIYNSGGAQVLSLQKDDLSSGYALSALPSGVYICQMITKRQGHASQKILVR